MLSGWLSASSLAAGQMILLWAEPFSSMQLAAWEEAGQLPEPREEIDLAAATAEEAVAAETALEMLGMLPCIPHHYRRMEHCAGLGN